MKKTLVILAFMLIGTVGIAENHNEVINANYEYACKNWVEVGVSCGNNFWLCTDKYESDDDLIDDVDRFGRNRC